MLWHWNGHQYSPLNLHNSLLAVPAIIVCNGPSFAQVDATRLRGAGRVVVGVNNVYPRLSPDYWVGMDDPDCFDLRLWWGPFLKVCRGGRGDDLADGVPIKQLLRTSFIDITEKGNFWDWSANSTIHWSYNSFIAALQFTLWMGVRELVFVGVDLSHAEGDYADGTYLTEEQRATNTRLHTNTLKFMEAFVPQAATLGVRCVSCAPDSKLNDLMPHRPIEAVLAEMEAGCPSGRRKLHNSERPDKPVPALTGVLPPVIAPYASPWPDLMGLRLPARNVVLVLRTGGDFRPEHVHRLVAQMKCVQVTLLTDAPAGLFPGMTVIPLAHIWPGWWAKMEIFRPDVLPGEPFLYLDLDTTVHDLPDAFFTHPGNLALAPFTSAEYTKLPGYHQSGMMLLQPSARAEVWRRWDELPAESWQRMHRGDQDFLHHIKTPFEAWQTHFPQQIVSYKMSFLPGIDEKGWWLDRRKVKVICYHGKPRPWDVPARKLGGVMA